MSVEQDIAILEQVPMLRALGRPILHMIAMGAENRDVAAGTMLFAPGEKVDCAYVVQRGSFALSADPGSLRRTTEAGPGTMLGEFALLSDTARPLCAIARQPSMVLRISRSMFMKILENDADAAMRLRDHVAQRAQKSVAELLRAKDGFGKN